MPNPRAWITISNVGRCEDCCVQVPQVGVRERPLQLRASFFEPSSALCASAAARSVRLRSIHRTHGARQVKVSGYVVAFTLLRPYKVTSGSRPALSTQHRVADERARIEARITEGENWREAERIRIDSVPRQQSARIARWRDDRLLSNPYTMSSPPVGVRTR